MTAPLPPPLQVDQAAYDRLAADVLGLLGIDLAQYKPAQVWRRVNAFAARHGQPDAPALVAAARRDADLRQAFRDMLTINVSEFFRDPAAFAVLRDRFLAPLLRTGQPLRLWSAGCSVGFEPVTLAILVRELAPTALVRILATDIDDGALAKARALWFPEAQMGGVDAARRSRFFRPLDGGWAVRPELGALIRFARHDLLRDRADGTFDVVACRNVVIYFTEAAKGELYRRIAAALAPGGVLFVGATESILDPHAVGLEPAGMGFYRRPQ